MAAGTLCVLDRSDERSAFTDLFTNRWLWASVVLSLALQVAVIYLPFLQQAFSTVPLGAADWLFCTAVASSVLWLRELSKLLPSPTAKGTTASTGGPGGE